MPTLKTLFDAPTTSPLIDVDIEDVGAFFIQLTRADILQHNPNRVGEANNGAEEREDKDIASDIGASVHDSMAYTICNQIIGSPDSFHVKTLIKLLLSLQVPNSFRFVLYRTFLLQASNSKAFNNFLYTNLLLI